MILETKTEYVYFKTNRSYWKATRVLDLTMTVHFALVNMLIDFYTTLNIKHWTPTHCTQE